MHRSTLFNVPLGRAGLSLNEVSLLGNVQRRGKAGREEGSCHQQVLEGHFFCQEETNLQCLLTERGARDVKKRRLAHPFCTRRHAPSEVALRER